MKIDRIITMILRRLMNRGITQGINYAARRGKNPEDMAPAEKQRAAESRKTAKKARKAARLARRISKF